MKGHDVVRNHIFSRPTYNASRILFKVFFPENPPPGGSGRGEDSYLFGGEAYKSSQQI
jgi:hypothetical protein